MKNFLKKHEKYEESIFNILPTLKSVILEIENDNYEMGSHIIKVRK